MYLPADGVWRIAGPPPRPARLGLGFGFGLGLEGVIFLGGNCPRTPAGIFIKTLVNPDVVFPVSSLYIRFTANFTYI